MDPVLTVLPFPISLPPAGSRTLLRGLHEQLRTAILDGRLQPGLQLPATRALADACGVSRNTAVAAYDLLLSEGYLVTRPRSGAYVADVLPQSRKRKGSPRRSCAEPPAERLLARTARDHAGEHAIDGAVRLQARCPRQAALSVRDVAASLGAGAARVRGPGAGLRGTTGTARIARRHRETRVVCARGGLSGGRHRRHRRVAAGVRSPCPDPGHPGRTVVAIENPGYPALYAALAAVGAKIVPVPVDGEGMIVEKLPGDAQVICVTPSHQFPLGTAMSMRRRTALLEFAQARNAVVVEDDYDGEFRFGVAPLDALQSLDRTESVFYIGTFSKSLFPGDPSRVRGRAAVGATGARRGEILRRHALRDDRAGHARGVHCGRPHGAPRAQDARGLRRASALCCSPVCGTISADGLNRSLPLPDCMWRRWQHRRRIWTRSPSGHASWTSASIRCANSISAGARSRGWCSVTARSKSMTSSKDFRVCAGPGRSDRSRRGFAAVNPPEADAPSGSAGRAGAGRWRDARHWRSPQPRRPWTLRPVP